MNTKHTVLRSVASLVIGVAVLFSSAGLTQAQKKPPKVKPDPYAVVQVEAEVRVVKKSTVKSLKLEIDQDYKRAMSEYNAAKKEARKNKTKFDSPKPKKKKFKTLKASLKTKELADKFVEQLRKKAEKKGKKKTEKKTGKETGKKTGKKK